MMSTCCLKHVEAWNKYIKKECVKLVINQNDNIGVFTTIKVRNTQWCHSVIVGVQLQADMAHNGLRPVQGRRNLSQ
jgi:hypothetical protein